LVSLQLSKETNGVTVEATDSWFLHSNKLQWIRVHLLTVLISAIDPKVVVNICISLKLIPFGSMVLWPATVTPKMIYKLTSVLDYTFSAPGLVPWDWLYWPCLCFSQFIKAYNGIVTSYRSWRPPCSKSSHLRVPYINPHLPQCQPHLHVIPCLHRPKTSDRVMTVKSLHLVCLLY
jgi:hypothetical protein